MGHERIYMDHAAGSPLRPVAAAALSEALAAGYGNPGSPHREGQRARAALERARGVIGAILDVPPRSVIFAGGGTEAARIAVVGAARAHPGPILCSALEHPAVRGPAEMLSHQGRELRTAPIGATGVADVPSFLGLCREGGVAALLAVHHETGLIQPVEALAVALRARGTVLVCDAALAPGRIPLRPLVASTPLVSFSAHKFGGPTGMGVLIVSPGTTLDSPACGGHQEERLRAGTPNVPGALATAAALKEASDEQEERARSHQEFVSGVTDVLGPSDAWSWVGDPIACAGIHCLEFSGVEGEALMMNLDLRGIAVATGSSCALGGTDPSPGLLAMGFEDSRAARTLRISFGWSTTMQDVKSLSECIRTTLSSLSRLS